MVITEPWEFTLLVDHFFVCLQHQINWFDLSLHFHAGKICQSQTHCSLDFSHLLSFRKVGQILYRFETREHLYGFWLFFGYVSAILVVFVLWLVISCIINQWYNVILSSSCEVISNKNKNCWSFKKRTKSLRNHLRVCSGVYYVQQGNCYDRKSYSIR